MSRIAPFILVYVCNLSSKSLLYSDIQYPKYLKYVTHSIMLSFITIFTLCMCFSHIAIDFVFVLDMVVFYFLAIIFRWYAIDFFELIVINAAVLKLNQFIM